MASISTKTDESIYKIKNFLGLNESPDGDTGLKMGEAAVMQNFRITRERNLQLRPGYHTEVILSSGSKVRAMWSGFVGSAHVLLAVCGGHVWRMDDSVSPMTKTDLGTLTDAETYIFGYNQKAYILNGSEYYSWDGGTSIAVVEGYVPIVTTATPPAGGGTTLESVNKLTGKRKQKFSPDGTATVFTLAETNIASVLSVTGTDITWTADTAAGTVTFASVPEKGVNSIVITYDKGTSDRAAVTGMHYAELYNGTTDNRVFLYGNGSNQALYSGLDNDGNPSAEYFPDLNVLDAGEANTPITGMIRHFSRLLVFKTNGAYSVQTSQLTLDSGSVTAAFYVTPVQRNVGNEAPGQVKLVYNNPRTLWGSAVYDWKGTNTYITSDERVIRRESDRVSSTIADYDLSQCVTFDDEVEQEYYIFHGTTALVNNYGTDSWYYYTDMPVSCMVRHNDSLYFGTQSGSVMLFSRLSRSDDGTAISARWESGAMDFDRDWKRKYTSNIWVSIKPEPHSSVTMTMKSNRKLDYEEKVLTYSLSTLKDVDFGHWSFRTSREPQVKRVRIKVKKFIYDTLIFTSNSNADTVTILGTDFQVRYTGNVK